MNAVILVRFGAIPEVGRFTYALDERPERGQSVVVDSHRGPELGVVLDLVRSQSDTVAPASNPEPAGADGWQVLRAATVDDLAMHDQLRQEAGSDFAEWQERIRQWGLQLELIDVEWTLDRRKLILYVLGDRGAETTKLALQAAAEGQTVIEVQPVAADGVVAMPASGGGGCGSGGCGCHE
jgi:cell fate regulator YaaT (PSP1 superfamily)